MASIDIRVNGEENITKIEFSDSMGVGVNAYFLDACGGNGVTIDDDDTCVNIASKEDAQNLIKALEKAIELGWWN